MSGRLASIFMRRLRALYLVLSILGVLPMCPAQTGSWQAVESLAPETPISVLTNDRIHCKFLSAADDSITCELGLHALRTRRAITFDRNDVKQVRLELPAASTFAGAAIGTVAGVALGLTKGGDTLTKEGNELIGGTLFGLLGTFIGSQTHVFHGRTVYRK